METCSALLSLCAGNTPVTGEFPSQRPAALSFDVFFHLCRNKRSSKQSWCWWFRTPLRSSWRHCNMNKAYPSYIPIVSLATNTFVSSLHPAEILTVLTHWGWDKMATIFQTTFWNGFSWMKISEFRLISHWSLFLRFELIIFQHWLR